MPKGRDIVLPANSYITTRVDEAVLLRTDDNSSLGEFAPTSVISLLETAAELSPNQLALWHKPSPDAAKPDTWTYVEYLEDVRTVARAFIKLGLEPRKGVVIIGANAPQWVIADLGAIFAGGVAAGIYATNSPEACKFVAKDCSAQIAVVENEEQLEKFRKISHDLPELKVIVQYTGIPSTTEGDGILSWDNLLVMGRRENEDALDTRLKEVGVNQCCHLCYTSGTTGSPKGVMLSHDNLVYTARIIRKTFSMRRNEERVVSFLPLSHVAANITDIFLMIECHSCTYFADRNALRDNTLTNTLKDARPTIFIAVPRVWEKIHEKMLDVGRQKSGLKRTIASWAKKEGTKKNKNYLQGGNGMADQNGHLSLSFRIADKLVFQKVKSRLGLDKCLWLYSAAAPLSTSITEYFMSLDIRILEIYGMSESSGPQITNTNEEQRVGTIGKTLKGFSTSFGSSDGEMLLKGRNVMMGYLGNPEKTEETFDDNGWLRTGDIGKEGPDGFVKIIGRSKEILITSGGENVPPVPLEDALKRRLPCLSHAIVVCEGHKFLSCLLTMQLAADPKTLVPTQMLSPAALAWYNEVTGRSAVVIAVSEVVGDDKVRHAVQAAVDDVNKHATSNAQKIKKWTILEADLSIPGGELGPTLKVKRQVVANKYASTMEAMYRV